MTEEEIIRNQFASILNNLVNNKIAPTGTAILSAQQPMILLFEKLIYKINRQDTEINKLNNVIDKLVKRIKYDTEWFYSELDNKSEEEIKEYFMKEDK